MSFNFLYLPGQDSPSCLDLDSTLDTGLVADRPLRYGGIAWDPLRITHWCDKLVPADDSSSTLASKTGIRPFRFYCRRTVCTHTARRRDPTLTVLSSPLLQPTAKTSSCKAFRLTRDRVRVICTFIVFRKFSVYLISVDEYYLFHVQRKQYVQEEYLVSPDGPLFLRLLMKPARPLVLNELVLKAIFLGHVRQKVLKDVKKKKV